MKEYLTFCGRGRKSRLEEDKKGFKQKGEQRGKRKKEVEKDPEVKYERAEKDRKSNSVRNKNMRKGI